MKNEKSLDISLAQSLQNALLQTHDTIIAAHIHQNFYPEDTTTLQEICERIDFLETAWENCTDPAIQLDHIVIWGIHYLYVFEFTGFQFEITWYPRHPQPTLWESLS